MYILEYRYHSQQIKPEIHTFKSSEQVLNFAVKLSTENTDSEILYIFQYENQCLIPYEIIYDKRLVLQKMRS